MSPKALDGRALALALLLVSPLASPVIAQHAGHGAPSSVKAGPLVIEQPWSRATPGGAKVGGGYLRITNTGTSPDRLVGGSLAAASRFEVHEMKMDGSVMKMRQLTEGLAIPPGGTVELKPGGYHVMFLDLREPLKEGQTVKGTLVFERAGTVEVSYSVQGMGARGAAEHKH
jgi:copper(I)-binding protein